MQHEPGCVRAAWGPWFCVHLFRLVYKACSWRSAAAILVHQEDQTHRPTTLPLIYRSCLQMQIRITATPARISLRSMCVMNFVIIGVVTAVMEKHSISMMRFVCTVMFTALYCALHVHHIVWASFCVYNVLHVLLSPLKWKRGTIDDVRYNNKVLLMD